MATHIGQVMEKDILVSNRSIVGVHLVVCRMEDGRPLNNFEARSTVVIPIDTNRFNDVLKIVVGDQIRLVEERGIVQTLDFLYADLYGTSQVKVPRTLRTKKDKRKNINPDMDDIW